MAFSLGGMGTSLITPIQGWIGTVEFYMVLAVLGFFIIYGWLVIRRKRKLNKEVLEIYDLGNGAFNFSMTKGGWFKKRLALGGLWDYGAEDMFRLADNTPVHDVTHHDYRYVNGVLGLVVIRSPLDPKIVVPIAKFNLDAKSKSLLAEIAPADLRDAAETSIDQADQEMQKNWEKWAPYLVVGFIAIILVFSILLIAQYGKHNVDVTAETLKYVADKVGVINNAGAVTPSATAP